MKLLELTSRVCAVLGIAVLMYAGGTVQTAKAQTIIINLPVCAVGGGGTTCVRNWLAICDIGRCRVADGPAQMPNGTFFCCY